MYKCTFLQNLDGQDMLMLFPVLLLAKREQDFGNAAYCQVAFLALAPSKLHQVFVFNPCEMSVVQPKLPALG